MTHEEFLALMRERQSQAYELQSAKGLDYGTEMDMLADFKDDAAEIGVTPLQVWHVMAKKHWHAITRVCRGERLASEPIEQRAIDLANYAYLLLGLIEDQRAAEKAAARRQELDDRARGHADHSDPPRVHVVDPPPGAAASWPTLVPPFDQAEDDDSDQGWG